MAIPQGRLSTTVVPTNFLEPEQKQVFDIYVVERGPIAIEDTTQGIQVQNWTFLWDINTGNFLATPEDTGSPNQIVHNATDVEFFRTTFDQAGRVIISYVTSVSSYLWWYDSQVADTVTTDLGSGVLTPSVSLDDKRNTQNTVNDILLWYIKDDGGQNKIYMKVQRDRFLTEYEMGGCNGSKIKRLGMASGLRVQLELQP